MERSGIERRRGRRVSLGAPLLVWRVGAQEPRRIAELAAKNVSLAGVYFETDSAQTYAVDEILVTSVAIPESQRRDFPFTRLAGRSRVVRVSELSPLEPDEHKRLGVALEFGNDVTVLTAAATRGG